MRFLLLFDFLLFWSIIYKVVEAHPLCALGLVFFESPVERTLSFSDMYDTTCFRTADDEAAQAAFLEYNIAPGSDCAVYHKQFLCAAADPYQAHLFDLESSESDRTEPFLCQDFCDKYATTCEGQVSVDCSALVGEAPYCLPVALESAGTGGLDAIVDIPGAILIDYADPGQTYDLWASFDGIIYKQNKDGGKPPTEFLRIPNVFNQGELGFLTFELDPGYDANGIIWAFYSVQEDGKRFNLLVRLTPSSLTGNPTFTSCKILQLKQTWMESQRSRH